ncbi:endonuclease VII domain-containing protein [Streptomyces sp. NPDC046925]|uniref:endonuclease VII domain-containing protein n=1 Tax=Streptomyces sp. NPDC046925 TaxID=3155375 RepID=UPI0033F277F9
MNQNASCPSCSGPLREVRAGRGSYLRCYSCKPARSKTGEDRQCLLCAGAFYVSAALIKKGCGLYCSYTCRIADKGVAAPEGFKHCGACTTIKPLEDFSINKTKADGRQVRCRACASIAGAKHRSKPEVEKAAFARHLERKYGITLPEYELMVQQQNGTCAICGGLPNGPGAENKRFDVDHCHKTGRVRGLLCSGCNRGIGFLGDDPARLQAAVDYLNK